jgi:hypothetical protein
MADGSLYVLLVAVYSRNGLWNAEYEGGVVKRYELSPPPPPPPHASNTPAVTATVAATVTMTIPVCAKQTTCPCIGGPDGDILFVTTASNFFSEASVRYVEEPLAGHLFMYKLPSPGYYIAESLFNDDTS